MEVKTAFQLKLNHILVLKDEIAEIKSMIEPEDCGHMITTVNFLENRVELLRYELEIELKKLQVTTDLS